MNISYLRPAFELYDYTQYLSESCVWMKHDESTIPMDPWPLSEKVQKNPPNDSKNHIPVPLLGRDLDP